MTFILSPSHWLRLFGFLLFPACGAESHSPLTGASSGQAGVAVTAGASGSGTAGVFGGGPAIPVGGAFSPAGSGGSPSTGAGQTGLGGAVSPAGGVGGSGGEATFDPRGHEGPLFGGQREAERLAQYYFAEAAGMLVIEAEHFATQRYGDDDYRGARWWMVNSAAVDVKGLPEFAARCQIAQEELQSLDKTPPGSDRTIRSIITNHRDSLLPGWEQVFAQFGCDPDESHAAAASAGQYIELLPDALYDNHDVVPHAGCNWYVPEQSPRVYYRARFSEAGVYELWLRAMNSDTDSGDLHWGVAQRPGEGEKYISRVGPERTGKWEWVRGGALSVVQGEYWILLGGREDGFEVDKLVLSRVGCPSCVAEGPAESAVFQP